MLPLCDVHSTAGNMARKDYFNLMTVARIYLFVQLFSTPLLLSAFPDSALTRTIERELYFPLATSFSGESVAVSALAYACFLCGGLIQFPRLKCGMGELDWHSSRVERMFWVTFLIGFAFKLARFAIGGGIQVSSARIGLFGETATYFMSLNWFHMMALPFLAIAYYENLTVSRRIANYYPLVLLCYLANGAINGATSFVVFPLAIHLAISQRYRPVGGLRLLCLAFFLLAVIYLKVFMKVYLLNDPQNQMSVFAPLAFLVNRISVSFVVSSIVGDPTFSYGYGIFEQFLYCLKIPGYEYAVPDGNAFGRFYSIIRSKDFVTGVSISVVGDLILHWGIVGAGFGMFAIGALYRWVCSFTEVDNKLSWVIYAMLWPIMLHGLESPVSVLLAAVLKMTLLCAAYFLVGRFFLAPPPNGSTSGNARSLYGN